MMACRERKKDEVRQSGQLNQKIGKSINLLGRGKIREAGLQKTRGKVWTIKR